MPTAFSVAGSPVTTAGTLAVTGAGTVGQYIRGDGSLADFPATTGGGSSVSYYLNGSVSQGTIGGVVYRELNRTPIFGAGTDISIGSNGYIANFITDAGDPNKLLIPAGNWNLETYFSASSNGGSPSFYVELYKYNGTTFTLIATSSSAPELIAFGTNLNPYFSTLAVPETVLALTDRLALRYYVNTSGRTITLHTENNHLCQVITTFTTGLTALNGLTNQVQFFAVGTAGTDFAISSVSDTHTFNLPTASATNRGALSSADWTTFNGKTSNLGTVTSVGLSSATSGVTIGSTPVTTSGTITLAIATASGSQNGLLSSTDWTTFNGKQNALTNPVTGTGTSGTLPKFTGSTTIGNSLFTENGTNGAFGGANYLSGTDLRSFNISAALYPGIGFFANNVSTGNIFSYAVTGNLIINADPGNLFADTRLILATDNTERFAIFNNGNVTIANSPTDAGFKLDVNGTGRFSGALTGTSATFTSTVTANDNFRALQTTTSGNSQVIADSDNSTSLRAAIITFGSTASDSLLGIGRASNSMLYKDGGKLAIGTRSSFDLVLSTSDTARLTIASTGASTFTGNINQNINDGTISLYKADGTTLKAYIGNLNGTTTDEGYLALYKTNAQKVAIRASGTSYFDGGNVAIGSTNAPSKLSVQFDKSVGFSGLGVYDSQAYNASNHGGTVTFGGIFNSGGSYTEWSAIGGMKSNTTDGNVSGDINFYTRLNSSGMTQRMIITSGGDVFIGCSSDPNASTNGIGLYPNGELDISRSGGTTCVFNRNTSTGEIIDFRYNNSQVGSISTNGTTTSYNITSDYRLKEDLQELKGLEKVLLLKVYDYKWKSENSRMDGVLAHELAEVLPYAVNGDKDGIKMQGVDYSKIVPILIKSIQELKQEIDTLKN
jgi:hypothetical protein